LRERVGTPGCEHRDYDDTAESRRAEHAPPLFALLRAVVDRK